MEQNEILKRIEELEKKMASLEGSGEKAVPRHRYTVEANAVQPGQMAYVGNFQSQDERCTATFNYDPLDINKNLLSIDTSELDRVIEAFASPERLNIIKILIQRQVTAKELMAELNFATTGKLYHHLSILENIGVLKKYNEYYRISARYVSAVLLIFAGVESILRVDKKS